MKLQAIHRHLEAPHQPLYLQLANYLVLAAEPGACPLAAVLGAFPLAAVLGACPLAAELGAFPPRKNKQTE